MGHTPRGVCSSSYNPMKKEGTIILGIGDDNSVSAQGTSYEGVMTSGYPYPTENPVQPNVVTVRYATISLTSGTTLTVCPRRVHIISLFHHDTLCTVALVFRLME
ncbi:glycoside hydrolase family 54 protein [Peniophora sp. CONT]|nr:glycoside hydrolase family 54 protein [Peniophora sp. CONT]